MFMLLFVTGLYKCHKYKLEWRFRMCYIALGVVGVGSSAFHATLQKAGQVG